MNIKILILTFLIIEKLSTKVSEYTYVLDYKTVPTTDQITYTTDTGIRSNLSDLTETKCTYGFYLTPKISNEIAYCVKDLGASCENYDKTQGKCLKCMKDYSHAEISVNHSGKYCKIRGSY